MTSTIEEEEIVKEEEETKEETIKLICNRCTGRTFVIDDFTLKKDGVSRTKSCRFCNEYFKKYEKERKEEERKYDDPERYIRKVGEDYVAYDCVCGSTCDFHNKYNHFKTIKHRQYINDNPEKVESNEAEQNGLENIVVKVEKIVSLETYIICECGASVTNKNMKRHCLTMKHEYLLKKKTET